MVSLRSPVARRMVLPERDPKELVVSRYGVLALVLNTTPTHYDIKKREQLYAALDELYDSGDVPQEGKVAFLRERIRESRQSVAPWLDGRFHHVVVTHARVRRCRERNHLVGMIYETHGAEVTAEWFGLSRGHVYDIASAFRRGEYGCPRSEEAVILEGQIYVAPKKGGRPLGNFLCALRNEEGCREVRFVSRENLDRRGVRMVA